MNVQEFFDCFYNNRKIRLLALRHPSVSSVLALVLDNKNKNCPFCSCEKLNLIPNELIEPPPPKTCSECGLFVEANDYSFELGLCRWCDFKKSSRGKMLKVQGRFRNYIEHEKAKEEI
jgi:hypothetical protein